MPREASRPKGWLSKRLDPLGWSLHGFSEMLDEHYKQALRWNSGVYEPPAALMEWIEKAERFFAENPPPKRADYAKPVRAAAPEPPTAYVQRIINALKPGETALMEDVRLRIGARRKAVEQRLAAAEVSGRLGPLRVMGDSVYRAMDDEAPMVPEPAREPVEVVAPVRPMPAAKPAAPAAFKPMTTDEGREHLQTLGWSQRDLGDILKWPGADQREVRRWFQDHERFPMPPEVATWLRGVVEAKRAAEARLPAGMPDGAKAAVVSAAITGALGDPTKVRDAALEARKLRPRHSRADAVAADEPVTLEDILPPDYSGPGRGHGRFVDLTKGEG